MIGIWIIVVITVLCGIGGAVACAVMLGEFDNKRVAFVKKAVGILVCILVAGAICFASLYWLYNTESGARSIKSYESDYQGGIQRVVSVYDVDGDLIKEYTGTFDVTYDTSRVLFDDENGKRHVIYYTTGTVIIDEIGEENQHEN